MSEETIDETVRRVDPDRYFSALFAPASARRHLLTLYAFNHEIARVAETVRQPMMGEIRLEWWRETLENARNGKPRDHPLARALSEVFAEHRLPADLFDAILDARAFDATPDLFVNWSDVEAYCDQTSGNLMRLGARILGGDEAQDALAREAGTAYAIAGLIRSLRFHAARHKVYLPQDLLGVVGLLPDQIMAGKFDAKVKAAIAQTVLKAEEHCRAARLIKVPPRTLLPAFLPAALVRLYLRRAKRRSFDPLKQSGDVAQHRKQLALLRAALRRRL
jgi:phytoene synthase